MKGGQEKPVWVRYAVTVGFGLVTALLMVLLRGDFAGSDAAERWRLIADAFFVPGALLLGVGLMIWISGQGEFDILSFGVKKSFSVLLPRERREAQPKTLFDYKQQRAEKGQPPIKHLLIVGLVFVLLGGIASLMNLQADPLTEGPATALGTDAGNE